MGLHLKFGIDIDTDELREVIRGANGKVKPGSEERVAALLTDVSIACALKASIELAIPQIVEISARNLACLVAEFCEEEPTPSNVN